MDLQPKGNVLATAEFATVGIVVLAVTLLAALILVLAHWIGPGRSGPVKDATYESGMDPIGDTRRRFNVRFYLVAVLFLVFDVELLFLYPWATLAPRLHASGAGSVSQPAWSDAMRAAGYSPVLLLGFMGAFFALLLVGFLYEWRRGVFKWN